MKNGDFFMRIFCVVEELLGFNGDQGWLYEVQRSCK